MRDYEDELNALFGRYRSSCPQPEAGAGFMPGIWRKIEVRHSFWFVFQRCARTTATVCAALCLLLLLLNFHSTSDAHLATPTYADALAADHTAELTYYAEAIRNSSSAESPLNSADGDR
jgi:hypothetical protein